jgi:hypothetical protein
MQVRNSQRSRRMAIALLFGMATSCTSDRVTNPQLGGIDSEGDLKIVASVTVTPGSATGNIGDSARFTAVARTATGSIVCCRAITWFSTDSSVVTVSASGMGRGVGAGSAVIRARIGGVLGSSAITVLPDPVIPTAPVVANVAVSPGTATGYIGDAAQFSAVATDSAGNSIDRTVTWSSSDTAVATITTTGYATAVGIGSAQLIATVDGVQGVATVSVVPRQVETPPAVASVTVGPSSTSVETQKSAQLSVTLRDSAGNVLTGRAVAWTSANAAIASVSSNGAVVGVAAGATMISASSEGISGDAAVTVTTPAPAPVASVAVNPGSTNIETLGSVQLGVTLRDGAGNTLTGRAVTWTSSNALIASVSGNGAVVGVAPGTATISASSEGVSGNASVTVTLIPPPPTSGTDFTNAPASWSLISDQPFDLISSLGWGLSSPTPSLVSVVSDASALLTPSGVLRMTYPSGMAGGSAPGNEYRPINARQLYSGMMWKVSNPWQGHASNVNKMQFLYMNDGSDFAMVMYGPPGGPYQLRIGMELHNADTRFWLVPNVNATPVTLGQWHKIEMQIVYNTTTSPANGIIRWWMDGQLIGQYTDILFPTAPMIEYQLSPTWGGMGDTKSQTDYYWFDHVVLKGQP